ncbi:uncharacterized protein LOC131997650 [Stomoxys calcitrans]|uniref:uncharacterized protein LOC131997650 n=1 Tax=Stomoxys calcitrans TaxID=35570 RepID=UPI0027E383FA|nr:uncharacterized protein LOC131997650 [Stomoxys calcitrans]
MCNIMNYQKEDNKEPAAESPTKSNTKAAEPSSVLAKPGNSMGYTEQDSLPNVQCAVGYIDIVSPSSSRSEIIEDNRSPNLKTELPHKCSPLPNPSALTKGSEFVKMTSAEKRRFKKALSEGLSREQALEIAKSRSESMSSLKRPHSIRNPFKTAEKKRPRLAESTLRESKINMGLVPMDLFEHPLEANEIDRLQEAIIDAAIETGCEIKPEFEGCFPRKGWLMVSCTNRNTAEWLKANVNIIKNKSNLELMVIEETDFPHSYYVQGTFPNSQGLTNSKILDTLEAQNQLKASTWRVLQRKWSEGTNVELTFSVDCSSWEKLKEAKGRIAYRFGHIKLELKQERERNLEDLHLPPQNWLTMQDNRPSTSREAQYRSFHSQETSPTSNLRFDTPTFPNYMQTNTPPPSLSFMTNPQRQTTSEDAITSSPTPPTTTSTTSPQQLPRPPYFRRGNNPRQEYPPNYGYYPR